MKSGETIHAQHIVIASTMLGREIHAQPRNNTYDLVGAQMNPGVGYVRFNTEQHPDLIGRNFYSDRLLIGVINARKQFLNKFSHKQDVFVPYIITDENNRYEEFTGVDDLVLSADEAVQLYRMATLAEGFDPNYMDDVIQGVNRSAGILQHRFRRDRASEYDQSVPLSISWIQELAMRIRR